MTVNPETTTRSRGDLRKVTDLNKQQLSIKLNSLDSKFLCPLCRHEGHANVGPQLFLSECWTPVCRECGDEHAPALSALLDLAACAAAFSIEARDHGTAVAV